MEIKDARFVADGAIILISMVIYAQYSKVELH